MASWAPIPVRGSALAREAVGQAVRRQVQRREHQRVGLGERRQQAGAAEHQPGLVAVPDGRGGIHHVVELGLVLGERREDAQPEHEAVEQYRSEEHTSELQSLMRISYAALCWKKKSSDKAIG